MEEFGDPWRNLTVKTFNQLRKACAKSTMSRFGVPTTPEQLEKLSKGVIPKIPRKMIPGLKKFLLIG